MGGGHEPGPGPPCQPDPDLSSGPDSSLELSPLTACSSSPTSPISVKCFPEQKPSSSGERMSSEMADSSSTLDEIFWGGRWAQSLVSSPHRPHPRPPRPLPLPLTWKETQPTGRWRLSSNSARYSATSAAACTMHCAASAWLPSSACFPAMFCSHVSRRSGEPW